MHIYLTGFMGAGKTTVGRLLAERLNRPFIDLDERVEADTGRTIARIFEIGGEDAFRELETAALRSVDDLPAAVVAVGGGAFSTPTNKEWMQARGSIIWLDVPFEVLLDRLQGQAQDRRPLFENRSQAQQLYDHRLIDYRDADVRIRISSADSAEKVAAEIRDILESTGCVI